MNTAKARDTVNVNVKVPAHIRTAPYRSSIQQIIGSLDTWATNLVAELDKGCARVDQLVEENKTLYAEVLSKPKEDTATLSALRKRVDALELENEQWLTELEQAQERIGVLQNTNADLEQQLNQTPARVEARESKVQEKVDDELVGSRWRMNAHPLVELIVTRQRPGGRVVLQVAKGAAGYKTGTLQPVSAEALDAQYTRVKE